MKVSTITRTKGMTNSTKWHLLTCIKCKLFALPIIRKKFYNILTLTIYSVASKRQATAFWCIRSNWKTTGAFLLVMSTRSFDNGSRIDTTMKFSFPSFIKYGVYWTHVGGRTRAHELSTGSRYTCGRLRNVTMIYMEGIDFGSHSSCLPLVFV